MNALLELDSHLLLLLNYFHTEFWDNFFWIVSSIQIWIPFYMMIIHVMIKGQKVQSWISILSLILLVVLCDQISTEVFKHGFERLRPTHDPLLKDFVKTVNNYRGGQFGFVSSHATNTMGLAVFSSLLFRNKAYSIFMVLWAILVGYSRIYLGVHFPGDIIGGMLLGTIIAYLLYKAYALIIPRFVRLTFFNKEGLRRGIAEQFNRPQILQVIFTGILTILLILFTSKIIIV
jgi:undecaprenyl-diphosphatase